MNDNLESYRTVANRFLDMAFEQTGRDIFLSAKAALASSSSNPSALLNEMTKAADRDDPVIRAFMASGYRARKMADLEAFSLVRIIERCRKELPDSGLA